MGPVVEFWSSVELGAFGRALLRALGELGISARQRFAVDHDQYRRAGGRLGRARLRWRSYVAYPFSLQARLRQQPLPDAIVVCTNTFYAPAVAEHAAMDRGVPVVHWIFDLFPDVLGAGAALGGQGLARATLARLTRWTFDHAAANVFLGTALRAYAEGRYGPIPRAVVIPVGADGEGFRAAEPHSRGAGQPLRVLYCGNFGRMHDTQTVVDLLRGENDPRWTMEFRGHGAGFRRVQSSLPRSRAGVHFGGSLGDTEWREAMMAADIALVTLKDGAEGLVMPSKTYSAMVAGQAILAVCPATSELAETVRRYDAGWVVEPGHSDELAAVLAEAAARPDEVLRRRRNAFRAGHAHYVHTAVAEPWAKLLVDVIADASAARAVPS